MQANPNEFESHLRLTGLSRDPNHAYYKFFTGHACSRRMICDRVCFNFIWK